MSEIIIETNNDGGATVITPQGAFMSQPPAQTATLDLDLRMARRAAKSISRSLDAELGKLERMTPGTRGHNEAKADYDLLDQIDADLRNVIAQLVTAS